MGAGGEVLAAALAARSEGLVVTTGADGDDVLVEVNPVAKRLLATLGICTVPELLAAEDLHVTRWSFEIDGRDYTGLAVREAGREERQMRRVAAFARTAARIACRGPLQEVLDRVAVEARAATGALACSIMLVEPEDGFRDGGFRVGLVGTVGHTPDYVSRFEECVRLGAPLASVDAYRSGRPARRSRLRELCRDDPRYAPLGQVFVGDGADDVVAVPAVVRGGSVVLLTSFFGAADLPTADDLTFLGALADQTAAAVDNADLFAQLQEAAAAAERHELAIDLHDSVSQGLFSVIMQSRAIRMRAGVSADAGLLAAAGSLEETAAGIQREIRELMRRSDGDADDGDLAGDLRALRRQLGELDPSAPRIELDLPALLPALEQPVRHELFLVVREAVTNAVRHSHAGTVRVGMTTADGELTVVVSDDGEGLGREPRTSGHLGLRSMARRTERLGGRLDITGGTAGTSVQVVVPLAEGGRP